MNVPVIEISKRAAGQLLSGGLWIFSNEVKTPLKSLEPGTWVNFQCQGRLLGSGYVNAHSLIAGRLCSPHEIQDKDDFFEKKIRQCLESRKSLTSTGSFRLVFSEGDALPGLIVDVYGEPESPVVVAQITTAGMEKAKESILTALKKIFNCEGLVLRGDSQIRQLEGLTQYVEVVQGREESLRQGRVREGDVLFAADFVGGQKTGFFLDQRENRASLGRESRGLRILDLCCYSGGWGLTALKNGAASVTFVDQSAEALTLVERGAAMNQVPRSRFQTVTSDVFDFLESATDAFDIVVADPPAFVKSKKNLPQALRAYGKLNTLALKRIRPEGLLYSCSCSFHLGEQDFENVLRESLAKAGQVGTVAHRGQQASDHPWVLNRPETHYLKCLALRVNSTDEFNSIVRAKGESEFTEKVEA